MRGHVVTVDQPQDAGGQDYGPTPTELFVASVASCVEFYARRYLARHHIDPTGLSVRASYHLAAKPPRVDQIEISIDVPTDLPATRRDALLAVANHCTVHNSLTTPPRVEITLADRNSFATLNASAVVGLPSLKVWPWCLQKLANARSISNAYRTLWTIPSRSRSSKCTGSRSTCRYSIVGAVATAAVTTEPPEAGRIMHQVDQVVECSPRSARTTSATSRTDSSTR
ncbi:OsmC family protein [Kribbella steppae]|nr:OsmC family protein [Kribbella steppae]